MKFPCQRLHLCGDILVAARGARINLFNVQDGSRLGTWARPSGSKTATAAETEEAKPGDGSSAPAAGEEVEQGPPTKRRKVDESGEAQAMEVEAQDVTAEKQNGQGQNGKKAGKGQTPARIKSAIPETPFVTLLAATKNGSHIVAVTSPDKNLWVLEHDGKGNLRELSSRPMPKRPCAIAVSPDDKTIFSADKFGDVYSLPLIPSPAADHPPAPSAQTDTPTPEPTSDTPATPQPSSPSGTTLTTTTTATDATGHFKSSADPSTVHTKRNLRALRHQALYGSTYQKRAEGPAFEHTLLLGHVSMLTGMALASSQKRDYIITADRDEHVRVSRAPPHAHVIETFCLGHGSFVSSLCVARSAGRPDVLVSAGGDDALYVWRWEEGALCGTADLLSHVRRVDGAAAKIAVTGLHALSRGADGQDVTIFAFCERIQAAFAFALSPSNTLVHTHTTPLPGLPLDAVVLGQGTPDARLLVSIDSSSSDGSAPSGIIQLQAGSDDKTWTASAFALQEQEVEGEGEGEGAADLTAEELQKLLYTTETLRKSDMEEGDEFGGKGPGAAGAADGEAEQQ
ncbi:uncharacterized protein E0L32_000614 [Thyridium curvatum]|uniref:Uncharacterized protein n=1 Tax=Thyridium curvatum TaxID=1093900 RepID=A0A507BC88_9PEZI|nr:uncharacterized protein E0L32_000614 [Thyridium curvatum]TPX14220.1 hypothetical protein E0L32_000614 [Thyridium curvatum]